MVLPVLTGLTLKNTFRWLTAGYTAVLLCGTHLPGFTVSFGEPSPVEADKILHFVAYGGLGFLLGLTLCLHSLPAMATWFLAVLSLAGLALVDEVTQPFFGREAEVFDWVSDVVGAAVGLASVGLSTVVLTRMYGRSRTGINPFTDNETEPAQSTSGKWP